MAAGEEEQKKDKGKALPVFLRSCPRWTRHCRLPQSRDAGGSGASSRAEHASASQNAQPRPQPAQPQPYQALSAIGWFLHGEVGTGHSRRHRGDLAFQSGKQEPPPPAPAYPSAGQNTAPTYSAPPATPQAPSRPEEHDRPSGQNLVLSTAQIRYCLAEDIRMDAAKSAVNGYSDSDVDRFNAMVADYSSRCGSFRYRSGALGKCAPRHRAVQEPTSG